MLVVSPEVLSLAGRKPVEALVHSRRPPQCAGLDRVPHFRTKFVPDGSEEVSARRTDESRALELCRIDSLGRIPRRMDVPVRPVVQVDRWNPPRSLAVNLMIAPHVELIELGAQRILSSLLRNERILR